MPRPANGQKLPTLELPLMGGGAASFPQDLAGALVWQLPEEALGVVEYLTNQH